MRRYRYQTLAASWREKVRTSHHSISTTPNAITTSDPSKEDTPSVAIRIAIVGSGPSGCYTAKYLQASKKFPTQIDILERLPTAFGLVRNGVAPDHPEVKNVQHDFEDLLEKKNVNFYGNVEVGKDVQLQELRELYDMVVLCYGCESDRSLKHLEGGHLAGILSAREFVSWYNGHIDFDWVGPIVKDALSSSKQQNVVVVGHGNVALDCARILAKTRDELDPTDLTTRALDILHPQNNETIQHRRISVVGRRGHVQGAFTIKELRELTKLPHTDFLVRADELDMGKSTLASQEELAGSRPRTRMDKLLTEASQVPSNGSNQSQIHLRFLLNPKRFDASPEDSSKLGSIVCERTKLQGESGSQGAVGIGSMETIEAQLALLSIGYKGVAIKGTEPWFDESRGVLKNTHGLVDSASGDAGAIYAAGWLKRGPSGIIGTNIPDAKDTVATMLHDMDKVTPEATNSKSLARLLTERGVEYVDWEAYQRIDKSETSSARKRHNDQPREKITVRDELLEVARAQ